jgi:hypothetical protein
MGAREPSAAHLARLRGTRARLATSTLYAALGAYVAAVLAVPLGVTLSLPGSGSLGLGGTAAALVLLAVALLAASARCERAVERIDRRIRGAEDGADRPATGHGPRDAPLPIGALERRRARHVAAATAFAVGAAITAPVFAILWWRGEPSFAPETSEAAKLVCLPAWTLGVLAAVYHSWRASRMADQLPRNPARALREARRP